MKKYFILTVLSLMAVTLFCTMASAEDSAAVIIDGKTSTHINVRFYSKEPYICIEDIFEYYSFETKYTSYTEDYCVEVSEDGNELMLFWFDRGISGSHGIPDASYTRFSKEAVDQFKIEPTSPYTLSSGHNRLMKEIDKDRHYVHYTDINYILKFTLIAAPDINTAAFYIKSKVPSDIVLYDKKGTATNVCPAFKDIYLNAGYKENLSDVLILPEPVPVSANGIKVSLNGTLLQFDVAPAIINGRTMVPLRAIFEALSATVEWDEKTRTVTSTRDDTTIKLTVDSNQMLINGKAVSLDCPATVIDGRTLVPARAVSEAFGINVGWDAENSLVILREDKYKDIKTVIMYNLSDLIIEVPDYDANSFQKGGWYSEKPVTIYATDGSSKTIAANEKEKYLNNGWLDVKPTMMYAPDGRKLGITPGEEAAYEAVGWYTYPVTIMYSIDGRSTVVPVSDVDAYTNVGWYTEPVTTMYAHDGRTAVVPVSQKEAYISVGWYTSPYLASFVYYTDIDAPTYDSATGEKFLRIKVPTDIEKSVMFDSSNSYVYTCNNTESMSEYSRILKDYFGWEWDSSDINYETVAKNGTIKQQAKNYYIRLKKGQKYLTVFYGFSTGTTTVYQWTYK